MKRSVLVVLFVNNGNKSVVSFKADANLSRKLIENNSNNNNYNNNNNNNSNNINNNHHHHHNIACLNLSGFTENNFMIFRVAQLIERFVCVHSPFYDHIFVQLLQHFTC